MGALWPPYEPQWAPLGIGQMSPPGAITLLISPPLYKWLIACLQASYSQFMAPQEAYSCLMDSLCVPSGQLIGVLWVPLENSDWSMVPSTANDITDITTSFT